MGTVRRLARGVVVVAALAGPAAALEHPELLPEEQGCERWLGGASANDPDFRLNLVLCNRNGVASGHVQWSSLTSGWNVREISGSISPDKITLHDVRITEDRPQAGWRFCTIDVWDLRRTGDRLEGTYDSAACNDHGVVWFEKMKDKAEQPKPAPVQPKPPAEPPPPKPPSDKPADRDKPRDAGGGTCRCATSATAPDLFPLLLVAFALRRRRR